MSQEIKTVMVLGGSGNLGSSIVSSLSNTGFQVSILSHSTSKASSVMEKVRLVQSDYTYESLVNAFQGQDAIVTTVQVVHFEDQKKIIDAAIATKVKRFLPNEFGVDNSAQDLGEGASFFKVKAEVVAYLKQKQTNDLSWTALCTGLWIDWILSEGQGLLGFDIRSKTGTMLDFGEHKFTATTLTKVGEATAAVLLRPEETKNQYVQVSSFTLTQRLVRETLEKKSGGKFYMNEMTVAELFAVAKKYQEEGDKQGAYHRLVTAFVCSGNEGVCFPEKARHWNKVLGLDQKETLDEVIERVLVNVSNTENRS